MSDDKPKKKRFEGLIQFKDGLRQTIVCLQASMEFRFASSLQSELIRKLDDNSNLMHHLLFAEQTQKIGQIDSVEQIQPHHLLTQIYQLQGDNLRQELSGSMGGPAHLSIWLDPSDHLITSYFFRLVSLACNSSDIFDLKNCLTWGSLLYSKSSVTREAIDEFILECIQTYGFCQDRIEIMQTFINNLSPSLQTLTSIHLIADGSYIGLLIEGKTGTEFQAHLPALIQNLASSNAHTIAINSSTAPNLPSQFVMLTPLRIPNRTMSPFALKGLVLINRCPALPPLQKTKMAG